MPAAIAVMAPYVNSYRRYVRGHAAPINLEWGRDNRTTGLRVPVSTPERGGSRTASPGMDCNPYLCIAASLACGYLGMVQQTAARSMFEGDAYKSEDEIPYSLSDALDLFEERAELQRVLGEDFSRVYSIVKRTENEEFLQVISPVGAGAPACSTCDGARSSDPERPVPGTYPSSWYACLGRGRRCPRGAQRRAARRRGHCGGRLHRLWAAKVLAEAGLKPVILEAHRVGWGASGRNGGQVGTALQLGQRKLEVRLGRDAARAVWDVAEAGKRQLREFVEAEAPRRINRPGVAHGEYSASDASEARKVVEHLARHYDYHQAEVLERDAFVAS
jgi:hypothetical protein